MKVLVLLGLGTWLLCGACAKKSGEYNLGNQPSPPTNVVTSDYSYLALGDSYTIGQSVRVVENFPNQLVDKLKTTSSARVSLKIVAQTGWTTGNLINAIHSSNLNPKYDFVTLLIGVNNQYRGADTAVYRKEFGELLQTSINYAGGNVSHVFVLSIPDWGVTPFAGNNSSVSAQIASEIDAYNLINKEETSKQKANYLDITPISREAKNRPSLIASDGLHPSAEMYSEWVKLLAPLIVDRIK